MMCESLPWHFQAVWPAEPACIAQSRAFVSSHLAEHDLPTLIDPVRLVVSELVTNAVLHSQSPFTVTLARRDHEVRLAVKDGSMTPVPTSPRQDSQPVGGRGLYVVDMFSSSWGVTTEKEGKSVWATFTVTQRQPNRLTPERVRASTAQGGHGRRETGPPPWIPAPRQADL